MRAQLLQETSELQPCPGPVGIQKLLLEMLRKTNDGAVADAFLLSTDPVLVAAGRAFWGENRRTTTMDEQGRVTREQAK